MTRSARAALFVPLVLLAGCASDGAGAMVACERFVDLRVGRAVQHATPMQGQTVEGAGPFVVRGSFVEPDTGARSGYTCTVERDGEGWRLLGVESTRVSS